MYYPLEFVYIPRNDAFNQKSRDLNSYHTICQNIKRGIGIIFFLRILIYYASLLDYINIADKALQLK